MKKLHLACDASSLPITQLLVNGQINCAKVPQFRTAVSWKAALLSASNC
jgi:hypothetical protein